MESFPKEAISFTSCPSKGLAKLAPGEYTIKCPYDISHEILNTRYFPHLEKCRRNYYAKYLCKDEKPFELTCKYNSEHQIPAPEITYHEYACPDWDNFFPQDIRLHRKIYEEILAGNFNLDLLSKEDDDDDVSDDPFAKIVRGKMGKISEELDLLAYKLVIEGISAFKPYLFADGEVLWADPAMTKTGMHPFEPKDWKLSQTEDPIFHHRRRYTVRRLYQRPSNDVSDLATEKEKADDEDDADSWQRGNQPNFDWLHHQYAYRPTYSAPMRCPPGLSRRDRENFSEWNMERLKTIFGVVPEEDSGPTAGPSSQTT